MKLNLGQHPFCLKRMYWNPDLADFIGFYSDPRYIWSYKNDQGLDMGYSIYMSIPAGFDNTKRFYI